MFQSEINPTVLSRSRSALRSRGWALVLALLCLGCVLNPTVCAGSQENQSGGPNPSARIAPQFAIADFDGDKTPDIATVEVGQGTQANTPYWVAFQLSSGPRRILGLTAPVGGIQISSRDVNGDQFPDVVISAAWGNWPIAVLLNDGFGNFTESDPASFPGAFSNSGVFLAPYSGEIADTPAGLGSRYPSELCQQVARLAAPSNDGERCALQSAADVSLAFLAPFRGRAPPSSRRCA